MGMHRSGTSALARTVSLLGCELPRHLLGAAPAQPTGHWEPEEMWAFNDALLAQLGLDWADWRPIGQDLAGLPDYAAQIDRARAFLRAEFGQGSCFVLKEPRLCRLAAFWFEALMAEGVTPLVVMPLRNPCEVAQSLQARDGIATDVGLMMWLRHVLDAEFASRGFRRMACRYEQLLENWAQVAERMGHVLGIVWARDYAEAAADIDAFLNPELHRQQYSDQIALYDPQIPAWVRQTYEILHGWAVKGENEADRARLDAIRNAFDNACLALDWQTLNHTGDGPGIHARAMGQRFAAAEIGRQQALADVAALQGAHERALQAVQDGADQLAAASAQVQGLREELDRLRAAHDAEMTNAGRAMQDARERHAQDLAALVSALEEGKADHKAEQRVRVQAEYTIADHRLQIGRLNEVIEAQRRQLACKQDDVNWLRAFGLAALAYGDRGIRILAQWRRRRFNQELRAAGLFDTEAYLARNDDVARAGHDPLRHFLQNGLPEGRAPL
ncbi:MAG TPA: hypothetical protein VN222_10250 [Novosphingobium sp.]|nr:hypothetical protein [Novosphingobium sp.]